MKHEKFHYHSLEEVRLEMEKAGVTFPLSENLDVLKEPFTVKGHTIANRLAIQPMEGFDSVAETGAPGELTHRRYQRFATSGVGLMWEEATAVVQEGRSNPRQLWIHEGNVDDFKKMIDEARETAIKETGVNPVIIMQATHSGRYSKPQPYIACHNPVLEKTPLDDSCIVTDDYLKSLEEKYGEAARLAKEAGFDGIDIKACHRYLMSELLSAHTRPGEYGGSFENRTRLYRNAFAAAKAATPSDFILTSRMNVFDAIPYPYGFGVSKEDMLVPDLSEPIKLVQILRDEYGVELMDYTVGNPYSNPHVNRPFDMGAYEPPYHAVESIARACFCFEELKKGVPGVKTISSLNSYLRHYSPYLAAGMVEKGACDMAGFGRMAFAYPTFARDILEKGSLDEKKCCITCSKCTELMRSVATTGCVIRDAEMYGPIYKKNVLENEKDVRHMISNT